MGAKCWWWFKLLCVCLRRLPSLSWRLQLRALQMMMRLNFWQLQINERMLWLVLLPLLFCSFSHSLYDILFESFLPVRAFKRPLISNGNLMVVYYICSMNDNENWCVFDLGFSSLEMRTEKRCLLSLKCAHTLLDTFQRKHAKCSHDRVGQSVLRFLNENYLLIFSLSKSEAIWNVYIK